MIEAIATSATADILVWAITGISGGILTVQMFLLRATLQNKRLLTGEDGVESDKGIISLVDRHEKRLDQHDERIDRHEHELSQTWRKNND